MSDNLAAKDRVNRKNSMLSNQKLNRYLTVNHPHITEADETENTAMDNEPEDEDKIIREIEKEFLKNREERKRKKYWQ